jgi:D-lactate dehydrogenase (cytochrome)
MTWNSIRDQLRIAFGTRFSEDMNYRATHASQETWLPSQPPQGVVWVTSEEEVVTAVNLCRTHQVPLIPYGAGTSIEGQVNAPKGGLALDMSRMADVLEVYLSDRLARVQPGITREALNTALRPHGQFFPVDPGANATLGGMASTRASGTHAVRYGTMRSNVQLARVVLPSGNVVRLGSLARKSAAGFDMLPLFIGAEGTLGVITELTLRTQVVPRRVVAGTARFKTVDNAVAAVIKSELEGVAFKRIELLDAASIRAANKYSGLDLPLEPHLFYEIGGTGADLEITEALAHKMFQAEGARDIQRAASEEEHAHLWRARHETWWATQAQFPGRVPLPTDVCVPVSRLAECIKYATACARDLQIEAPLCGHVGDGNFHTMVLIDPDDNDARARAHRYVRQLAAFAIAAGGTITGEHGIGQGKKELLVKEAGAGIELMKTLKGALDPSGFMNPGKIFDL